MKKPSIQPSGSLLPLATLTVSIVAIVIAFVTNQRANDIAATAGKPQVLALNSWRLARTIAEVDGIRTVTCNSRIRLVNVGGADTVLRSLVAKVHLGPDSADFEMDDVTGATDIFHDILFTGYITSANRSPIIVTAHSTIEIEAALEVESSREKYDLHSDIGAQPAEPNLTDVTDRQLWIEYIFLFPDSPSASAPLVFCTYVSPPQ